MKRVFHVELQGSGGSRDVCTYKVIADTAEKAIVKAKVQSKRDTGEKYDFVQKVELLGKAII